MLKKLAGAAAVGLVLLVVIGLARGSAWHVEKSIVIAASPSTLRPFLTDFEKGWMEWSVWKSMDQNAKWTFGGTPGTAGHFMQWSGPEVGSGKLTFTSVSDDKLEYEAALESSEVNDHASLTLSADEKGTKITWRDEGTAPPVVGGLFRNMLEKMLGEQFDKSLKALKEKAEKKQKEEDEKQKQEPPAPPPPPPPESPPTP